MKTFIKIFKIIVFLIAIFIIGYLIYSWYYKGDVINV